MIKTNELRDRLNARKGDWRLLVKATSLNYWWVTKFAQGTIREPGLNKAGELLDWLDRTAPAEVTPSGEPVT